METITITNLTNADPNAAPAVGDNFRMSVPAGVVKGNDNFKLAVYPQAVYVAGERAERDGTADLTMPATDGAGTPLAPGNDIQCWLLDGADFSKPPLAFGSFNVGG